MERKIKHLTIMYLVFLSLLFASGGVGGIIGNLIYALAFLLPFVSFVVVEKKNGVFKV